MSNLIDIILPIFILMAIGYVAVRTGAFSDSGANALLKFSQNFAIPFLLFRAISTLDLSIGFNPGLLVSYYTGSLISFALALLGARFMFARPWQDSVVVGFCALFANSVLLGLPIMERAFGVNSLAPNYAIVALHAPICYFLGIVTMEVVKTGGGNLFAVGKTVISAMFHNALMIGIALGFAVNLSGLQLPEPLTEAVDLMILAALPTALFALGGVLSGYRPEGDMKLVLWICLISLVLHPSVALLMTTQVFDLPTGMVRSAVLTAAMAPGVNTYIFANMYRRAKRVAATAVLVGTAASVVSVTFWLQVLQAL